MISNQETFNLSPYMAIYDIVVPKDNILRQSNELVDFHFVSRLLNKTLNMMNNYFTNPSSNDNPNDYKKNANKPILWFSRLL